MPYDLFGHIIFGGLIWFTGTQESVIGLLVKKQRYLSIGRVEAQIMTRAKLSLLINTYKFFMYAIHCMYWIHEQFKRTINYEQFMKSVII